MQDAAPPAGPDATTSPTTMPANPRAELEQTLGPAPGEQVDGWLKTVQGYLENEEARLFLLEVIA